MESSPCILLHLYKETFLNPLLFMALKLASFNFLLCWPCFMCCRSTFENLRCTTEILPLVLRYEVITTQSSAFVARLFAICCIGNRWEKIARIFRLLMWTLLLAINHNQIYEWISNVCTWVYWNVILFSYYDYPVIQIYS